MLLPIVCQKQEWICSHSRLLLKWLARYVSQLPVLHAQVSRIVICSCFKLCLNDMCLSLRMAITQHFQHCLVMLTPANAATTVASSVPPHPPPTFRPIFRRFTSLADRKSMWPLRLQYHALLMRMHLYANSFCFGAGSQMQCTESSHGQHQLPHNLRTDQPGSKGGVLRGVQPAAPHRAHRAVSGHCQHDPVPC